jgi:hypothetical protein
METTMTIDTSKETQVQNILQNSVCMVLSCGYVGNYRTVDVKSMKMEKDGHTFDNSEKDEVGAHWKLFSRADLLPVERVIFAIQTKITPLSVDGGLRIFGSGAHLIPKLSVSEADKACQEASALLDIKKEELVEKLPAILERRKEKLGPLFKADAYPTADEIRARYTIKWNYVSFGAPDQLMEVDAAIAARAEHDWNTKLSSAYQDVVVGLRESAALVMKELANKLRPNAEGNPKALRPEALNALNDLLQRLPILNSVGQDEHLTDALARIGALAQGIDVETLRKAPAIRAMLLETAEKTAETLDALVTTGRRAMNFDD